MLSSYERENLLFLLFNFWQSKKILFLIDYLISRWFLFFLFHSWLIFQNWGPEGVPWLLKALLGTRLFLLIYENNEEEN
jgi:hypothetical protein